MIEIPEAIILSKQMNKTVRGKSIKTVVAAQNPHKWAWYHKDPADYPKKLGGRIIGDSRTFGSFVVVEAVPATIVFSEGVKLRYFEDTNKAPEKHQLYLEFRDSSALVASVQMYGGLFCFSEEKFGNKYYQDAQVRPSPLSDEFNMDYFCRLFSVHEESNLSVKGFLATEQRIPGLGNGILQDILFNARIHPRKKLSEVGSGELERLFSSIKNTISKMVEGGGRDTEKDLFGNEGGYRTRMSRNTLGTPCSVCSTPIEKAAYMGGTVYFCPTCQML